MGNFATLKEKFGPEKRFTRLAAVRKPCILGFVDLLVYSTLIFRVNETGCTARQLALLSGLDRTKTVPKSLQRLSGLGLAIYDNKRWHGVQPPESISGWFVLKDADQLRNRFGYNWIAIPAHDSPLTNLQAAIITQLALGRSPVQISRWLRVSVKTVARTKRMIKDNGGKFKKVWFQDKGKIARKTARAGKPQPKAISLSDKFQLEPSVKGQLERNINIMRTAGLKDTEINTFWSTVLGRLKDPNGDVAFGILYSFGGKFQKISADHKANVKKGKAVGDTCIRLLCSEYGV